MLSCPDFCPLRLSSGVRHQHCISTSTLKHNQDPATFSWTCASLAFCLYLLLAPRSHFRVWGRCKCLSHVCRCSWLKTAGGLVLCFCRLLICLLVPNWLGTSWDIDNCLSTIFTFTHRLDCQKRWTIKNRSGNWQRWDDNLLLFARQSNCSEMDSFVKHKAVT